MTRIRCFTTVVAQVRLRPAVTMLAVLALAVPAGASGQGTRSRGAARVDGQAVPRGGVVQAPIEGQTPQAEAPRAAEATRSAVTPSAPPARRVDFGTATALPRTVPRVVTPQVVVPQAIQPGAVQPQKEIGRPGDHPAYWPNYRSDYRPHYHPSYRPRYRPEYRVYYRPYYTFLPRVRLGFGLWVGHPVTYPVYFYPYVSYPYAYTYPPPDTFSYPTSSYPVPGTAATAVGAAGGLSFEIQPPEAGAYVDGQYVGMVSQFSPNQPPLALAPGRHHVEIRAPGFEIVAFDVDILPGQVIPYQGELRRF